MSSVCVLKVCVWQVCVCLHLTVQQACVCVCQVYYYCYYFYYFRCALLDIVRDYPGEPVPERYNQMNQSGFVEARDSEWQRHQSHLAPDRPPRQYPTAQFFTGWMPFLTPNQQRQTTEGISKH